MSFADNAGVRIHYEVVGEGEPLVLLHGTAGTLNDWSDNGVQQGLEAANRLILIDLRGHGASDKPHEAEAYDWPLLVQDVCCVLDAIGDEDAHIFGYSAGSYMALGLAMTRPERVRSLILGGASPRWTPVDRREMFATEGMAGFLRLAEAGVPVSENIRAVILANDPLAISASLLAPRCTPSPEELRGFSKPSLLMAGENDVRFEASREMASQLPDARFVAIPGLDHVRTYLQGETMLPHVKAFLAQHGG